MNTPMQEPIGAEIPATEEGEIRSAYRNRYHSEPPEGTVEPLVGIDLPLNTKVRFIRDLVLLVRDFAEEANPDS